MTDVLILCALFGIFILVSFIKGIQIGIKLRKDEPIENFKIIEPIKNIVSKPSEPELTEEQQIEWNNINNYDGTRASQQEIERR